MLEVSIGINPKQRIWKYRHVYNVSLYILRVDKALWFLCYCEEKMKGNILQKALSIPLECCFPLTFLMLFHRWDTSLRPVTASKCSFTLKLQLNHSLTLMVIVIESYLSSSAAFPCQVSYCNSAINSNRINCLKALQSSRVACATVGRLECC